MSDSQSLSLSDEEGLCADSIPLSSDTQFDMACFAAVSGICTFICSFISVTTLSTTIALPVLRWMNAAIDAMKDLVESSFPQTLLAASPELK